jgi:hypothetical protein
MGLKRDNAQTGCAPNVHEEVVLTSGVAHSSAPSSSPLSRAVCVCVLPLRLLSHALCVCVCSLFVSSLTRCVCVCARSGCGASSRLPARSTTGCSSSSWLRTRATSRWPTCPTFCVRLRCATRPTTRAPLASASAGSCAAVWSCWSAVRARPSYPNPFEAKRARNGRRA